MAQLKDTTVTGSLQVTDTVYGDTGQFQVLKAPTTSDTENKEYYKFPTPDNGGSTETFDILTSKFFNFKQAKIFTVSAGESTMIFGSHILVFYYYGGSDYGIVSFWKTSANEFLQPYIQQGTRVSVAYDYMTNNTTNENHYFLRISNTASSGTIRGYYITDSTLVSN